MATLQRSRLEDAARFAYSSGRNAEAKKPDQFLIRAAGLSDDASSKEFHERLLRLVNTVTAHSSAEGPQARTIGKAIVSSAKAMTDSFIDSNKCASRLRLISAPDPTGSLDSLKVGSVSLVERAACMLLVKA